MTSRVRPFLKWRRSFTLPACAAAVGGAALFAGQSSMAEPQRLGLTFFNAAGVHRTISDTGPIDEENPFFQPLGTNGRSCVTCHRPAQAWTITPAELRDRFDAHRRTRPDLPRQRRLQLRRRRRLDDAASGGEAFSLLLTKGLIRVGRSTSPPDAEFEIVAVDDPYRCGAPLTSASMYRRPLPTANLRFLSARDVGRPRDRSRARRSATASSRRPWTRSRATRRALRPPPAQVQLDCRLRARAVRGAGRRSRRRAVSPAGVARGGPDALATRAVLHRHQRSARHAAVDAGRVRRVVRRSRIRSCSRCFADGRTAASPQRQAIARGEAIFNTRQFVIDNVPGLNGAPGGSGSPARFRTARAPSATTRRTPAITRCRWR